MLSVDCTKYSGDFLIAKVESKDLVPHIADVLARASTGSGREPHFLTSYQILRRLPSHVQNALRDAYGPRVGQGGEANFGPASRVGQAALEVAGVEQQYLDTRGLRFIVGEEDVGAGNDVCSLFRLRER
jgi:hypothetical protein